MNALQRAIDVAGSQTALAVAVGVKQAHIWNWLNRGKKVPAEQVLAVESAVNGAVTRHELRPDIYPPPGDATPEAGHPAEEAA